MNDRGEPLVRAPGRVVDDPRRKSLAALVGECRAVEIRDYEELPSAELFRTLVPAVLALVDRALHATAEVRPGPDGAELAEAARAPGATFYREVDRAVEGVALRPTATAVADLAFMVKHELSERRRRLAELSPAAEPWLIVAQAGSALRRVTKALSALENLLSLCDGRPPLLSHTTELQIALGSRRLYRAFTRRLFEEDARPTPPVARFRKFGTEIAVLIGKPAYGNLRVADRVQFRLLQGRILEWLRRPSTADRGAERLWQDLVGFGRILTQINQRQELLEHDRAVLERIRERARIAPLGPPEFALLDDIEGRDERIDALTRERSPDRERWLSALDAALRRLSPPAAEPPGLDESFAGVEIELEPGDYESL